jgi:hypothetical protein
VPIRLIGTSSKWLTSRSRRTRSAAVAVCARRNWSAAPFATRRVAGGQVEQADDPGEPAAVLARAGLPGRVLHRPQPVSGQAALFHRTLRYLLPAEGLHRVAPDLLDDATARGFHIRHFRVSA